MIIKRMKDVSEFVNNAIEKVDVSAFLSEFEAAEEDLLKELRVSAQQQYESLASAIAMENGSLF